MKTLNNLIAISGKMGSGKDTLGKMIQILAMFPKMESKLVVSYLNKEFYNHKYVVKKFADKLKDIACILLGCSREMLENRAFKEKELGEEWWKYYYKRQNTRGILRTFATSEEAHACMKDFGNVGEVGVIKLTPRLLLQLLGTECGREILHPNIWCNALFSEYQTKKFSIGIDKYGVQTIIDRYPNWVITDMRFPNEFEAVDSRGGITIRVNRLKVGDIVYWDDPEQGLSSGVYRIRSINNKEAWILQQDSMAEAQVLPSELSLFKDPQHESETALDNTKFDYTIDNNGSLEDLVDTIRKILF